LSSTSIKREVSKSDESVLVSNGGGGNGNGISEVESSNVSNSVGSGADSESEGSNEGLSVCTSRVDQDSVVANGDRDRVSNLSKGDSLSGGEGSTVDDDIDGGNSKVGVNQSNSTVGGVLRRGDVIKGGIDLEVGGGSEGVDEPLSISSHSDGSRGEDGLGSRGLEVDGAVGWSKNDSSGVRNTLVGQAGGDDILSEVDVDGGDINGKVGNSGSDVLVGLEVVREEGGVGHSRSLKVQVLNRASNEGDLLSMNFGRGTSLEDNDVVSSGGELKVSCGITKGSVVEDASLVDLDVESGCVVDSVDDSDSVVQRALGGSVVVGVLEDLCVGSVSKSSDSVLDAIGNGDSDGAMVNNDSVVEKRNVP